MKTLMFYRVVCVYAIECSLISSSSFLIFIKPQNGIKLQKLQNVKMSSHIYISQPYHFFGTLEF